MNNSLTKIRSKYLLTSFGLNLVVFMMIFAIYGFRLIYESNDDIFLSHFIVNGYDKCLFISYFITVVLVPLQRIFTIINVWMVSQFLFNFISVVIIVYIFLSKFGMKLGILFSALFHVTFGYYNFISLQFTRTSVTMATAGYLLIISVLFSDKKSNHRWINIKSVLGATLVVLSSFYRFESFLSVSGVFFVFLFALLFVQWLWSWKEKTKINYFLLMKKLIFIVLVFVMAFSLEKVSGYIKTSDTNYLYHEKYQAARSACVDILPSPYQGNEQFYNSIGIFSDNDIMLLCKWTVSDENFFTLEKLTEIAEYSKKDTGFMHRFSESVVYINNIISSKLGLTYPIIIILTSILVMSFLVLIIVFRNKWKMIFSFLFTMSWLFFVYLFYALYQYIFMYMVVFPGTLMILLSFLCNRYSFIIHCFMSVVLFSLITYLEFTYTNFRATYTLIFPAMCIIIYHFDRNALRSNIRKLHPKIQKGIFGVSIMIYLLVAVIVFKICPFIYSPENDNSAFTYIESHKENFYFLDEGQRHAMKNFDSAIWKPELSSNSIHTSWATGSEFFHKRQKEYHLEYLYADMIDNPNAFYVSDKKISMVEKYYNDHYSNGKNNIVFEQVENDVMKVYRICTKG